MTEPDRPVPGTATPGPTPASQPMPPAPEPGPKPPSRVGRFFRLALRWAVGIIVVFALGLAATWFTQVQPKASQVATLTSALGTVQAQATREQQQLNALQGVQAENATLKASLDKAQVHLELLKALEDVTSAQVELAQGNPSLAKAYLAQTDSRLAALGQDLQGSDATAVKSLQDRLGLASGELETNSFAAQRDLEVLASDLVNLEMSLFGG